MRYLVSSYWLLISVLLAPPRFTFADPPAGTDPPCPSNKLCNPLNYPTIDAFIIAMLNVVVQYGALLVVFFLVYAGFQFVTAQGNTEKIASARKMFVWVVVGAFVLLGVYVIREAICGTLTQIGVPGLQC